MNKILKLFMVLVFGFALVACKYDDEPTYEGESLLNFYKGVESSETILSNQTTKDVEISFGSISGVSGNHQVKLVVDAANSTAVEGVDFTIVQNPIEITSGQNSAKFTIRIIKAAATEIPKVAVFKLQSATLKNAVFNQTYTMSMSLTCPVSTFVGNFQNTGWWMGSGTYQIIEVPNAANTLKIVDFLEIGHDFVIKYDAAGKVTFDPQQTGYMHPQYGMVSVKMSTDATKVSTIDMCSRKLVIWANWYVSAGTFGNQKEEFTGL